MRFDQEQRAAAWQLSGHWLWVETRKGFAGAAAVAVQLAGFVSACQLQAVHCIQPLQLESVAAAAPLHMSGTEVPGTHFGWLTDIGSPAATGGDRPRKLQMLHATTAKQQSGLVMKPKASATNQRCTRYLSRGVVIPFQDVLGEL